MAMTADDSSPCQATAMTEFDCGLRVQFIPGDTRLASTLYVEQPYDQLTEKQHALVSLCIALHNPKFVELGVPLPLAKHTTALNMGEVRAASRISRPLWAKLF